MSEMIVFLILLAFVGFLYGLIYVSQKFSWAKNTVHVARWGLELANISIEHWGTKREYLKAINILQKAVTLADVLTVDGADLRSARTEVRRLVNELHHYLHPDHPPDKLDMDAAVAAYMFLIAHEDMLSVVRSIRQEHSNIEVKKATNLAIDVLGELISRKTELSQQYFQHLIYGINRALLLIKKHGTDKRTLKKVVSTLFRVYKLSRAYRHRIGLKNITEVEFYVKVARIFGTLREFPIE